MRYQILLFLLMTISSVVCFRMNDNRMNQNEVIKYQQELLQRIKSQHPQVQEERELGDGNDPYTFKDPGMNNKTNNMEYEFQDYRLYNNIRWLWNAYLLGANATWYAPNSTICFNNALNIAQFDVDLLMIKYMYGNVRDNMLNTTYFISNISDVSYSCLDAGENLYVYAMYKFRLFGEDWTNVMLGALQNLLKMTLSINKINNKLQDADDAGRYDEVYYHFGRITQLLLDYDPVILEDAGNPLSDPDFVYRAIEENDEDDSEIFYQSDTKAKFNLSSARAILKHPLVKDTIIPSQSTPVTNAALYLAIAGSSSAPAFTRQQLNIWVGLTYVSADPEVLAAAKTYYSLTFQLVEPEATAIITRQDFNAWWASCERNENLRTAFFNIQTEAWKVPYGGGTYGPVNLQKRDTQLRNKYPASVLSDSQALVMAQSWMLKYDGDASGTVSFSEWIGVIMGPTNSGAATGFNPDDDSTFEDNQISVITGRTQGGAGNNLLSEWELFDWTFGLKDDLPGLKYLMTVQGPVEFWRGFINGTQLIKDNDTYACDDILSFQVVPTIEKFINVTETLFGMEDFYEIIYVMFDDALLITRMSQLLFPTSYYCYYAGENTYWHFDDVIVVQNGYSPKPYLMNIVYNFGHIWDTCRDFYLFWAEDPRGQVNSVHDAGYNLGWALYLFITPGIASYQTQAVAYTPDKFK